MTLELTDQQQRSLDTAEGGMPRVVDPRTNATYVLVPEEDYAAVREAIEEERRQGIIRAIGRRNAAGRIEEEP